MLSMEKKLELWEKELQPDKLALLAYACKKDVEYEVDTRVDRQVHAINQALTTSISAALFDFTELSIPEVEAIIEKSNEYMKDSEEFLIKYGEDWIMKINEIKPKIKEESFNLLPAGRNQQQSVKALGELFLDVPRKDLVNIFQEAKQGYLKIKPEIDEMVISGLQEIQEGKKDKVAVIKSIQKRFNLTEFAASNIYLSIKSKEYIETCPNHYIPNDAKNKAELEEKESSKVNTPKKENESTTEQIDKPSNAFEVVEKKLKFKGEYYDYEKDKTGLKVGCEFFKSLEEIEAFRKREAEEFEKMIAEVRAAFNFEG